jgi:hypothetical protein
MWERSAIVSDRQPDQELDRSRLGGQYCSQSCGFADGIAVLILMMSSMKAEGNPSYRSQWCDTYKIFLQQDLAALDGPISGGLIAGGARQRLDEYREDP